jgi:hypothetical protein
MHHLPTHKAPTLQSPPAIRPRQQRLHLLRRARPQTRHIPIKDQTEGDQGDEIGEEQLKRLVPEVIGCDQGNERAEQEDGDEGGNGAGLELEDSVWRCC